MTGIDLAAGDVGGAVIAAADQFFGSADRLLAPSPPEWREGAYTDRGKWMDGWETRRRREEGHDWCIVRLGIPGLVHHVVVDTTHFRGNYPESFGIDGCGAPPWWGISDLLDPALAWQPLVERATLSGDTRNEFEVAGHHRSTFVRLRIYPDGGIARLRVLGTPLPSLGALQPEGSLPDLASVELGGTITGVSDDFFSHASNLLKPHTPAGMFDGWETRRRRGPGGDWVVVRLGLPGRPRRVLVDTAHFRGNAPGWVSVEAGMLGPDGDPGDADWTPIVPRRRIGPDRAHLLEAEDHGPVDHVRLSIHPDGGVARLRVFAQPDRRALRDKRIEYLNTLYAQEAERFFLTACGATAWAGSMVQGRPYSDPDHLRRTGERAWSGLSEADWLEAFATHPRIGERHGRQTAAGESMSRSEQAGTEGAASEVRSRLAEGQARYESRFGFPFIVFARDKTGDEILDDLDRRLEADRGTEMARAAEEQRRITESRLARMMCLDEE